MLFRFYYIITHMNYKHQRFQFTEKSGLVYFFRVSPRCSEQLQEEEDVIRKYPSPVVTGGVNFYTDPILTPKVDQKLA